MRRPRSHRRIAVALTSLSLLLGGGAFAPAAQAGPASFTTGISGLYEFEPEALTQTAATGARFVRVVISWQAIAPPQRPGSWNPADPADPAYDWTYTDQMVRRIVAAGMTPVALVTEAPAWAQGCQLADQPAAVCRPDPSGFAAFARAAAARYNGDFDGLPAVRYWEPINEPNLSMFFYPQFVDGKPASAALYRPILNSFYESVHGVNAANQVLGGGLGPIEVKPYTIGPMAFTRQLLCMTGGNAHPRPDKTSCEGGVHFDIFDVHPYTTGGPTHRGRPNDVQMGDLGRLQRLLRAAKKAGRIIGRFEAVPLWITEFSWDSKPPDPGGLPMAIEKRWVPEAMYRAWQAGVSHFFWYQLRDDPITSDVPTSQSIQSGLYFRGGSFAEDSPKPYLQGFRFPFVAYPGKRLRFWGVAPGNKRVRVVVEVRRRGKWRRVATSQANAHGVFQGSAGTGYGRNRRGSVRARTEGQASLPFGMKPIPDFHQPPFGR